MPSCEPSSIMPSSSRPSHLGHGSSLFQSHESSNPLTEKKASGSLKPVKADRRLVKDIIMRAQPTLKDSSCSVPVRNEEKLISVPENNGRRASQTMNVFKDEMNNYNKEGSSSEDRSSVSNSSHTPS